MAYKSALQFYGIPGRKRRSFAIKISEIVERDIHITRTIALDVEIFAALLPLLAWNLMWRLLN